jgi:hypothetical protein
MRRATSRAVHAGQADVQQHHFGPERRVHGQGAGAVAGNLDFGAQQPEQHGQGVGGVDVVIDHQDAAEGRCILGLGIRCLSRRGLRLGGQGQVQPEFAALALAFAERLHAAAVHLDQAAHQGQPDAQAALPTAAVAVHLHEQIEHLAQQGGRDADAVVAYRDHGLRAIGPRRTGRCGRRSASTWRHC